MDQDILMPIVSSIQQSLSSIESDVSSIRTWMPEDTDIEGVNAKLDTIIKLLEKIERKL